MIQEDKAESVLKEWHDKLREPWGGVDNIMKIHSLNFNTLKVHYELYLSAMKGTKDLSYKQREMIAVVVSNVNQCNYWIIHHGAGLRKITNDDEFFNQFVKDYKTSPISDQDKKMLGYSVKLSL